MVIPPILLVGLGFVIYEPRTKIDLDKKKKVGRSWLL